MQGGTTKDQHKLLKDTQTLMPNTELFSELAFERISFSTFNC